MAERINIYGPIGFRDFDGAGVLAEDVVSLLAGADGDIEVHVNSPGGIATDGLAIYNNLKAYTRGAVHMTVDGVAASAASLLLMAGTTITMAEGATLMIHEPAAVVYGPPSVHREAAAVLDMMAAEYAGVYARRSGRPVADVRALMADETWMNGALALQLGFADRTEGAAVQAYAFCWSVFRNAPPVIRGAEPPAATSPWRIAAMAAGRKEVTMDPTATPAATPPLPPQPVAAAQLSAQNAAQIPAQIPAPAVDPSAIRLEAATAERGRIAEINRMVMTARLPATLAAEMIDANTSLDQARSRVIDAMASAAPTTERSHITVTADEVDRWRTGAERSLMMKARLDGGERNEFSSLSLRELARASLDARGLRAPFRSGLEMVGAAFVPSMAGGMHSTSDFASVLQNVAAKSMLKGWEESPETFEAWTSRGSASDFKKQARVGVNLFPSLSKVEEGAEYTYGKMGDRGEEVMIATYGKLFAITRQAVINDDLSVLSSIPRAMGRASRRTIGNLVYAVLTSNPAMSDGTALFHADHGNLPTAAAPSTAAFDAARTAMGLQTDPDGHAAALNIRPKYVLVPLALEGKSKVVISSETDVASGQANPKLPNSVRDMAMVISEGRLDAASATAWYMAADPMVADTIEVTYLDGVAEPMLEQKEGWTIDGTEFKVRIDAGVKALDYRGLLKNAGV
ncbi:ClpP-like prohead protease/major capsid protein fusion protein [Methylobrevis pamukkalensis]|uniref:ATP-dependent Clp protease proteolytic subunit n=1 Tax=Methylobrevis pamukkalensis TaxID=1439726 RepID=A0A1E3GZR4_9HYPH|nr:ClpP-like prohead protease/major capsid protein fusion protein [Methylobrevis pamukkalensis]ODN69547.1 ATP-dependent Clp protease proteolytic subunit 1 [Methylobrevis pamukkalensis]